MKSAWPVALATALLASACLTAERPVIVDVALAAPTTSTTTVPITVPPVAELDRVEPLGLITPTGVVVPILETREASYLVRTPCNNEAELGFGTPIGKVDVVLDPGHGGRVETGAVGPNGLAEKTLNLRLAKRAATELRQRDIAVALTRTGDYRIPLRVRAEIADTLEATALISIHHNAPDFPNSPEPGTEVFIQSTDTESSRLGGLIFEEVFGALSEVEGVTWASARDAGVMAVLKSDGEEAYGMIRYPSTVAVLAEFGYLANPSEAQYFDTDEYLEIAGVALADAVERFLNTDDPGTGFNEAPRRFTPSGSTGGVAGCEDPRLE